MKPIYRVLSFLTFAFVFLVAAGSASAQPEAAKTAESNFEAILYVLADQASGGTAVPQQLTGVGRQIRNDLGVSNLRVINTYVGRLAERGTFSYKGVSNAYVSDPVSGNPAFLDFQLGPLVPAQSAAGQNLFLFQHFRFGARIPVKIGVSESGSKAPVPVNYESIGVNVERINIREGAPALIGTLSQPNTNGTLFLVLALRSADR